MGHGDAEVIEKELGSEFSGSAIADLNQYEAVVKMFEDGANPVLFRANTLSPAENWAGRRDTLVRQSRERFAIQRSVIEDKLRRWMAKEASIPKQEDRMER